MIIRVEKIFQSPCTPPSEVDYLVSIRNLNKDDKEEDIILLRLLEKLNLERLNLLTIRDQYVKNETNNS